MIIGRGDPDDERGVHREREHRTSLPFLFLSLSQAAELTHRAGLLVRAPSPPRTHTGLRGVRSVA